MSEIPARIHDLKTWPEYFRAVRDGRKRFEIRKDDREFRVGDCLVLREFEPRDEVYTGDALAVRVTYRTDFNQPPGFVVMSIEPWPEGIGTVLRAAMRAEETK